MVPLYASLKWNKSCHVWNIQKARLLVSSEETVVRQSYLMVFGGHAGTFWERFQAPYPTRVFETWRWSVNRPFRKNALRSRMDSWLYSSVGVEVAPPAKGGGLRCKTKWQKGWWSRRYWMERSRTERRCHACLSRMVHCALSLLMERWCDTVVDGPQTELGSRPAKPAISNILKQGRSSTKPSTAQSHPAVHFRLRSRKADRMVGGSGSAE